MPARCRWLVKSCGCCTFRSMPAMAAGFLNGLADSGRPIRLDQGSQCRCLPAPWSPDTGVPDRLTRRETVATAPTRRTTWTQFVDAMTRGSISDEVKRGAQRFASGRLRGRAGIRLGNHRLGARASPKRGGKRCFGAGWRLGARQQRHDETVFLEHLEVWLSGNRPGRFAEVDPVTLATLQAAGTRHDFDAPVLRNTSPPRPRGLAVFSERGRLARPHQGVSRATWPSIRPCHRAPGKGSTRDEGKWFGLGPIKPWTVLHRSRGRRPCLAIDG